MTFTVGHFTDPVAKTGCTVVVLPPETVASGEVRGGAPASREFALLDPNRTVQYVDAIVMSGGSAFGLATSDGVMQALLAAGRGYETSTGLVPIVVGMGIYDLAVGDGSVRPTAADGRTAFEAATRNYAMGAVGAGTGATMGNWRGADQSTPGGFASATVRSGDVEVTALITVNSLGEVNDGAITQSIIDGSIVWPDYQSSPFADPPLTNTTIGAIVTNAVCTKVECLSLAQAGHDGLARALVPAHTSLDGDALVAAAMGHVPASPAKVRMMAAAAVEAAIRSLEVPRGG